MGRSGSSISIASPAGGVPVPALWSGDAARRGARGALLDGSCAITAPTPGQSTARSKLRSGRANAMTASAPNRTRSCEGEGGLSISAHALTSHAHFWLLLDTCEVWGPKQAGQSCGAPGVPTHRALQRHRRPQQVADDDVDRHRCPGRHCDAQRPRIFRIKPCGRRRLGPHEISPIRRADGADRADARCNRHLYDSLYAI